jgi:membrane protein YqaA with SNARE-associated domain
MHALLRPLAHFFFALGGFGLLLLGTLDSSFLMLPLGNDLLVVALTAQRPGHMFYYVAMATLGSVAGVAFAHVVSSKTARKATEDKPKSRRMAFVERQIKKYGGWAIAFAALAPPGFPFTPFIVVSAALQYPLKRMLIIIAACRLVRFAVEGWLALIYGRDLIRMANSPTLQNAILVIVVISVIGSAISIRSWLKHR